MDDAKTAWVERVLGVRLAEATAAAGPGGDPLGIWRDAKDAVDGRLEALAAKLRGFDDPDLEQIADFGLYRVGTGEGVALTKALFDYSRAAPATREAAGGRVRASAANYRAALNTRLVHLIDHNPVGVDVAIQKTIGGALDRIEAMVGP